MKSLLPGRSVTVVWLFITLWVCFPLRSPAQTDPGNTAVPSLEDLQKQLESKRQEDIEHKRKAKAQAERLQDERQAVGAAPPPTPEEQESLRRQLATRERAEGSIATANKPTPTHGSGSYTLTPADVVTEGGPPQSIRICTCTYDVESTQCYADLNKVSRGSSTLLRIVSSAADACSRVDFRINGDRHTYFVNGVFEEFWHFPEGPVSVEIRRCEVCGRVGGPTLTPAQ